MTKVIMNTDRGGIRLYSTDDARINAIRDLVRRGFDQFTSFRDVNIAAPFGLQYGMATHPRFAPHPLGIHDRMLHAAWNLLPRRTRLKLVRRTRGMN